MRSGRDEIRLRRRRGPMCFVGRGPVRSAVGRPPVGGYVGHPITSILDCMKKKILLVLHVAIAVALCANGLVAPAAAEDGPSINPGSRVGPAAPSVRTVSIYDAFVEFASAIAAGPKASADRQAAPTAEPAPAAPPATEALPRRATPAARSYPQAFPTYDALIEHASSVAAAQLAMNQQLAAAMAREVAARTALADLMDDSTLIGLRAQLANDAAAARRLLADGAVLAPAMSWQMPLVGENTQDFGPTPFWFEPALTYQGVYYANFHTGTDIAAPWGTPIFAPAPGVVLFAGPMGDGAEVVVVAHDDGLVSLYAHLDRWEFPVPVKAGDTVHAGDRIGNVGLTGITTGAHLHWGVWRNGEPIDPLSTIGG